MRRLFAHGQDGWMLLRMVYRLLEELMKFRDCMWLVHLMAMDLELHPQWESNLQS